MLRHDSAGRVKRALDEAGQRAQQVSSKRRGRRSTAALAALVTLTTVTTALVLRSAAARAAGPPVAPAALTTPVTPTTPAALTTPSAGEARELIALQSTPRVLSGRIACAGVPGCNATAAVFGADRRGRALTQWTTVYDGVAQPERTCVSPNGNEALDLRNRATGATIGYYIDNEVDDVAHVYINRQSLIDCLSTRAHAWLILVGLYPTEAGKRFSHPPAQGSTEVGTMLEWYPYCDGQVIDSTPVTPPTLAASNANGYVVQDANLAIPGCDYGPTVRQQHHEWAAGWREVNGDQRERYSDLIGNF